MGIKPKISNDTWLLIIVGGIIVFFMVGMIFFNK